MDEAQFHKRLKEILALNRGPHNSPDVKFHEMMSRQVKGLSGKDWDDATAASVIQQFEWATGTQPKSNKISETEVKAILNTFLQAQKYTFTPIAENNNKTPDGYIKGNAQEYICEIKSPELILDIETQLYKYKTTHRKILNFIHTASKQFVEFDAEHELPRVLIFTSIHAQLNWKSFVDAIYGGVIDTEGKTAPDFSTTQVYKSTLPILPNIDLYVWYQVSSNKDKLYQASYFINGESVFVDECKELVENISKEKISYLDNTYLLKFS
ncbi:MAG: hypothetical protein EOO17_03840 [Chloroflexi bacterium]|nr:MAG: hypothetical protein EOO17_03840 [Chloroflexota bacterium]